MKVPHVGLLMHVCMYMYCDLCRCPMLDCSCMDVCICMYMYVRISDSCLAAHVRMYVSVYVSIAVYIDDL
jgi:hypothetical protein